MDPVNGLLLRFSQRFYAAVETLEEHIRYQRKNGYVWWGMIAKEHHLQTTRAVVSEDELSSVGSVKVGLFDRGFHRYAIAECTEIVFGSGFLPRESPEPEKTPNYYNTVPCPIWLKLNLEEVGVQKFRDYLSLEEGFEETSQLLIPLRRSRDGSIYTRHFKRKILDENPRLIDEGEWIMHISDLHCCGSDPKTTRQHRYQPITKPASKIAAYTVADIVESIVRDLKLKVAVVVASGDFTHAANDKGFDEALGVMDRIVDVTKTDRTSVVMVPGNHDLPRVAELDSTSSGTDGLGSSPNNEDDTLYRRFRDRFYRERSGIDDLEEFRQFRLSGYEDWQLRFLGLNSAKNRTKLTASHGYLGPQANFQLYMDALRRGNTGLDSTIELLSKKIMNFAVIHHHIRAVSNNVDEEEEEPGVILDCFEMEKLFADLAVHAVLHGHQHIPLIAEHSVHDMVLRRDETTNHEGLERVRRFGILGAGSAGIIVNRIGKPRYNSVSFYRPRQDGIEFKIEQYAIGRAGEIREKGPQLAGVLKLRDA